MEDKGPSIESSAIKSGRGYLYVIAAACLWALSGMSSKVLFMRGLSPFELVQLRVTCAAVVSLLWLLLRDRTLLRIARTDLPYFAALGGLGMASVQFTYLFAISRLHLAPAILLQYLSPGFIVLYTALVCRERVKASLLVALAVAFAGSYLVVGGYTFDLSKLPQAGILAGVCSALAFAAYSLQGEYGMKRYDPWTVLTFSMLFAAVAWNVVEPPLGAFLEPHSIADWGFIAYISVFGTMLPYGLYLKGISVIGSARASITAMLEPIVAGVLAAAIIGERLEFLQIAGGLLVIASVAFLKLNSRAEEACTK